MSNFHISQHVASVWDMLLQATGVKQAFFPGMTMTILLVEKELCC